MKPNRGKFITLEGGEGAGKSTQIKRLAHHLRQMDFEVIETREVGGCSSAEEIRELWLHKGEGYWHPLTEVLLIMAARHEHLVNTIWPALNRGAWVISDRFIDSTRAYQGIGLNIGLEIVDRFYHLIAGDFVPDLTLLLDIPVESGLLRVSKRGGIDDRYQQKNLDFHQVLRESYLKLAKINPSRIKVIQADDTTEVIESRIQLEVKQNLIKS